MKASPTNHDPTQYSKKDRNLIAKPPRRLPRLGIVVLLAFALLIGAVIFIGPLNIITGLMITLTEDTEYAPGYSERSFRAIKVGDSEASVRHALGTPFEETPTSPYLRWLYTPNPEAIASFEKQGDYPDIRYSFTTIDFNETHIFTKAFGQISHGSSSSPLGVSGSATIFGDGTNSLSLSNAEIDKLKASKTTPQQIEARFGRPQARFDSKTALWLTYSRSPGSKNYRQRKIGFDGKGRVCRKVDEIWWD